MLEKKVESYYESGKELIDELTDEKSERLTPQQKKLFRLELKLIEEEDVANMHTMSNSVNEGEDLDEYIMDEYPLPRHGYHHLLRSFRGRVAKYSIKLNTKITKISRQNGMVSVHTVDQHGSSSTYECKKVICTISLGLLKEKAIEFDPPLPAPQQHSIDTIGFGILDKVFLAFEKPSGRKTCSGSRSQHLTTASRTSSTFPPMRPLSFAVSCLRNSARIFTRTTQVNRLPS